MRVTFNSFPDTLLGRLQSLGSEQNKALTQLSTGQRITAPSDDAPAMQRILNLRVEKKQNQQYYRNATDGLEVSKVTFSSRASQRISLFVHPSFQRMLVAQHLNRNIKPKPRKLINLFNKVSMLPQSRRGSYILAGEASGAPDAPFIIDSKTRNGQNKPDQISIFFI
jgi:hypothetical protein